MRAENVESFNLKFVIKMKYGGKPGLFGHFKKLNLTKLYQVKICLFRMSYVYNLYIITFDY